MVELIRSNPDTRLGEINAILARETKLVLSANIKYGTRKDGDTWSDDAVLYSGKIISNKVVDFYFYKDSIGAGVVNLNRNIERALSIIEKFYQLPIKIILVDRLYSFNY